MAPVCSHYFHEPFCWGLAFYPICMSNCWWKSMGDLYFWSLQDRIAITLLGGGGRCRAACLPSVLRGLLEGHELGCNLSVTASQNLHSWEKLLGMCQLVLFPIYCFTCLVGPIPSSSFVQLQYIPIVRFAREGRGIDGASFEDLVYDVFPCLPVLMP